MRREVMEEVGLRVKNIRYYKSQPWAFSDTEMVGFTAELDGDDTICLEEEEALTFNLKFLSCLKCEIRSCGISGR